MGLPTGETNPVLIATSGLRLRRRRIMRISLWICVLLHRSNQVLVATGANPTKGSH